MSNSRADFKGGRTGSEWEARPCWSAGISILALYIDKMRRLDYNRALCEICVKQGAMDAFC
ncbi:MAG: hypothetical protein Kow0063_04090 [Anaerolineae bacterium]